MTLRVSWSSLRTHEECKQRGKLQRQGKRNTIDNQRVFFPGTVTDRVVRDWLLNNPEQNMGAMPDMVESIVTREKDIIAEEGGAMVWKDRSDRAQVIKDCREAVEKIEPSLVKYVLPFEYQVDFRFKAPVTVPNARTKQQEAIVLIGAMDILVKDNNGRFAVWDVKHTRDDGYWRKTSGQLSFYDLAVKIMFGSGTSITGLLQPLCKLPVKPVTLDINSRTQLMTRVVRMANDIWADNLPPRTDNSYCGFCNVKHACTKFQPVLRADGSKRIAF